MVYIFNDKFRISGNCVSIPIFKHYKYIVNGFVQLANLPSAVSIGSHPQITHWEYQDVLLVSKYFLYKGTYKDLQ
jgi:hypothetical protein